MSISLSYTICLYPRMLNFLDTKNWYTSIFLEKKFTPISKCDTWMESLRGIESPQNNFTILLSMVAKLWAPELPLRCLKFDQQKHLGQFSRVIHWCEAYDKWNLYGVVQSSNMQRFRNYKLLNMKNESDEKLRNLWFPELSNITVWQSRSRNCPLHIGRVIVHLLIRIVRNRVNNSFKDFSLQFKKESTIELQTK
jgi:hypothetical protein